jgi:hypothetical protein
MKWRKKLLISLTMAGVGFAIQQTPVGGVVIPTKDTIQEVENFTPPPPKDVKEDLGTHKFQIAGSSIDQLKQDLMANISNTEIPYDLNWLKNYVGQIGDLKEYPVACIEWVGGWCKVFEGHRDKNRQIAIYPTGQKYRKCFLLRCHYYDTYIRKSFTGVFITSGVPFSYSLYDSWYWGYGFYTLTLYFNGFPIDRIRWVAYSDDGVSGWVKFPSGQTKFIYSGCHDDSDDLNWCRTYGTIRGNVEYIFFREDGGPTMFNNITVDIIPMGQQYAF